MPSPAHLDLVVAHVHVFAAADNVAVRQRARESGRVDAEQRGDKLDLCGCVIVMTIVRGRCVKKILERKIT